jgi:hypothetical protein
MCVVCGKQDDYAKFNVIPTVYRVHLPDSLKSHRSHDIVLLCFECHTKAAVHQNILKKEISKKYNSNQKQLSQYYEINKQINNIRKTAISLKKTT